MTSTRDDAGVSRPFSLLAIAVSAVAAGAFIGATTNAINGLVSPDYFLNTMPWENVEDIWRAVLALGIFMGLIFGLEFAVIFTLVVGIVSKAQCTYGFAMRQFGAICAGVYACWIVGGLVGIGLAALSPEFFRGTFVNVPDQFGEMLRYAWVGGSIWGAISGGILGVVIGSILFAVRWRHAQNTSKGAC